MSPTGKMQTKKREIDSRIADAPVSSDGDWTVNMFRARAHTDKAGGELP
jgi:hypothetical protein